MRDVLWICGALFFMAGCPERQSSTGWGAQVPADATRFVAQPVESESAPAKGNPSKPPPTEADVTSPAKKAWVSEVSEPTTVTVWYSYRGMEKEALVKVVQAYSELGTQVKIKLRFVPFDGLNDRIKGSIPLGRGPDLIIFAHDPLGAWSEMGLIEPLTQWTRPEDNTPFIQSTLKALVYRKNLYALPLAFKSVALFYNKALVSKPPATWAELLKIVEDQHAAGRYGLAYEAASLYYHAPWVHGFGEPVLSDRGQVSVDTEPARQALIVARELVKTHRATPINVTTAMVGELFNRGKAAMVMSGPWMRGEIDSKVDYGVAPLPRLPNGKPARPFLSVEGVFMNKHSKNKTAAMEVLRWLVSERSAAIRFDVGSQPVANTRVWAERKGKLDPRMAAFKLQAESSVVTSSNPRMQQIWAPYDRALLSVIAGDQTPKKALAQAQKAIDSEIRAAGGNR